jgi:hypothetical protein
MLKLAKLAYVAALLTLAGAGTANMIAKAIADVPTWGVEVGAPRPVLSFAALRRVRDESFQRDFVAWFEQSWGLRGYAVRTDNTLNVAVFHETRVGQGVVVGDRGVLYPQDDIGFTNRDDGPESTIALARRFASLQVRLRLLGKALVPILIPSKTSAYRDEVPDRWHRRGVYRRSDANLYRAFVETLSASGGRFVDARALLTDDSKAGDVFSTTARHWRPRAGCRALAAAIDVARPDLPELGDQQIDCRTTRDLDPPIIVGDFDLHRLLNVWGGRPASVDVDLLTGRASPPVLAIPTLFVGSSFGWMFADIARDLDVLQPSLFYYYDETSIDTKTRATKKLEPLTPSWRDDTFGKRLIVVAVLETYLPDDGAKFLSEIEQAIAPINRPSHP